MPPAAISGPQRAGSAVMGSDDPSASFVQGRAVEPNSPSSRLHDIDPRTKAWSSSDSHLSKPKPVPCPRLLHRDQDPCPLRRSPRTKLHSALPSGVLGGLAMTFLVQWPSKGRATAGSGHRVGVLPAGRRSDPARCLHLIPTHLPRRQHRANRGQGHTLQTGLCAKLSAVGRTG